MENIFSLLGEFIPGTLKLDLNIDTVDIIFSRSFRFSLKNDTNFIHLFKHNYHYLIV